MKHVIKRRRIDASLPLIERIYRARGVENPESLSLTLAALTPFTQMKGVDDAVYILMQGLYQQKRFLIVGDFDADGATATAVAVKALKSMGAEHVDYIVPNRFEYGYGLTPEIVRDALPKKPDILITVDNGISSLEGVSAAKAAGLQVVITDHHLAPKTLPDADAIVNPNQPGCDFPSKSLAGVGVIFYVMLALRSLLREQNWFSVREEPNLAQLLDIVALGTVADVVPLDHNNRILVNQGLLRIRAGQACPGIQALLAVSGRDPRYIQSSDLGFALGPRLNAAGRLEDMSIGIACLLTEDPNKAKEYAALLDQFNVERKTIESDMQVQAVQLLESLQLEENNLPLGLSLYDGSWHQGVVGILSSRIKEQYHRPVICFTQSSEDELKGSARSVQGVHIRDVLDTLATKHPQLIKKFGGHAMAAGLTVEKTQFEDFSALFANEVSNHLTHEDCVGEILSDGPLKSDELNLQTAQLLQDAGPWGQHFPEPVFDDEFQVVSQRLLNDKHRKMVLKHSSGINLSAIQFNVNDTADLTSQTIHAAFQLDVNRWQGQASCQLLIRYCEPL